MSDPITVMIVDDHEMVRQGASGYLEAQPDITVVAEAESGEEAVRLAREHVPDVVLMDLVMPGMDGVEATRQVKDVSPRSQIIVLTSYHQDEHIFPALQAGAISYLLKDVKGQGDWSRPYTVQPRGRPRFTPGLRRASSRRSAARVSTRAARSPC